MLNKTKVVLVTGGAQRVGAAIVRHLHAQGWTVLVHYRHSSQAATALVGELHNIRPMSAFSVYANLDNIEEIDKLPKRVLELTGRLDALVNNASTFFATKIGRASVDNWDNLISSNARAPFFLSQALNPYYKKRMAALLILWIFMPQRPFKQHTIYCMAKAALQMMTYSLAKELAPNVRVNGVAPGAILWPEAQTPPPLPTTLNNKFWLVFRYSVRAALKILPAQWVFD
jgi:pteridine reductase